MYAMDNKYYKIYNKIIVFAFYDKIETHFSGKVHFYFPGLLLQVTWTDSQNHRKILDGIFFNSFLQLPFTFLQ